MKEKFETKNAPIPNGNISQVIISNNFVFISGLISQKPDGQIVYNSSIADQTKLILSNLKNILQDMNLNLDNIVRTEIYLSSMKDFDEMNKVYSEFFTMNIPPARRCVGGEIWGNLGIEISVIAHL